jgi:rhodanese-related sulfurtransferase
MTTSFNESVTSAQAGIELISPKDAQAELENNPETIILDVRDACDLNITGIIRGTEHVSMGTLLYKADHSMPTEHQATCLADKDRPIITTCTLGMVASIAAKTLRDYGFSNVRILDGGNQAWKEAGLPLENVE